MSHITKNTQYVSQALARLLMQFKGKPRLEALVTSWITPFQELEDAAFEVHLERTIDAAVGVQLEGIGDIVGFPKNGLSDTNYRQFIKAKIRVNRSNGLPGDLILIVTIILGVTPCILLTEYHPAAIEVEAIVPVTVPAQFIIDFLEDAAAAGVDVSFIYSKVAKTSTLTFGSSYGAPSLVASQKPGSSHSSPTGGGVLAGVLSA